MEGLLLPFIYIHTCVISNKCIQTLNLYHAVIFPYLIYCVGIWGNAANIYLDPLIKLQKKMIRVVTFSLYLAHTNDLFVQLQSFPFKKFVIHRIGLQMFKNNLGYIPKAVESLFMTNSNIHKYNTRNKDKMRSAYGKHEFMYRVIPCQITQCPKRLRPRF